MQTKPVVHHIPVCPLSQRLEILLELKGCRDAVDFTVVDIARPRDPELLRNTSEAISGFRVTEPRPERTATRVVQKLKPERDTE